MRAAAAFVLLISCTAVVPPAPDPTPDPPTPPDPPVVTRALIVGDVMLGRRVGEGMAAARDFVLPWRYVRARLRRADLAVANFESTLSRAGAPTQGDAFAADPRALDGLRAAGIDLVSLANNHTGDFGPRALLETLEHFRDAGIDTVGAGADAEEARAPAVMEANGIRFGFLAFNSIGETPGARAGAPGAAQIRMQPRTGNLNRADLRAMRRSVRALSRDTDVVIVYAHWGANYTHEVHPDQRTVGRALVEAGADVVVGTHPHWIQGMERHQGAPIVYSLGNFIFDMDFSTKTQQGIALELTFHGETLHRLRPLPVRIGEDFAPRFVRERAILRQWREATRALSRAA